MLAPSRNRHLAPKQTKQTWEHIKSHFSQNPTISLEQTTTSTAARLPGLRQHASHFREDERRSGRDVGGDRSRETGGVQLRGALAQSSNAGRTAFACSLPASPGCFSASAGRRPFFLPPTARGWGGSATRSRPLPTLQEKHFYHPASTRASLEAETSSEWANFLDYFSERYSTFNAQLQLQQNGVAEKWK